MAGAFSVTTSGLSLSANYHLFDLWYGTGSVVATVKKLIISPTDGVAADRVFAVKLISSAGSGGTTPTPVDMDSANDAASYGCRVGATTGGTDAGTLFAIGGGMDVDGQWQFPFAAQWELVLRSNVTPEGVGVEMLSTPGAETYSGVIEWREGV